MIIKQKSYNNPVWIVLNKFINKNIKKKYFPKFFFLSLLLSMFFFMGFITSKSGVIGNYIIPVIKQLIKVPYRFASGELAQTEKIFINIKHKDLMQLEYNRSVALSKGRMTENLKSISVPAKIKINETELELDTKINLTGFLKDHFDSEKWSMHLKIKSDGSYNGMTEFKLLHPKTRNGLNEWLVNELCRKEGLIALENDLVEVYINGNRKGIYFLENHFDKILVEKNKHRESIIFKPVTGLKIYDKKKVLRSEHLKKQLSILQENFNYFLNGKISTYKIFDVDKLAKWYAITDLVGGFHQLSLENMHLYLNPITNLIEPIGREWQPEYLMETNPYVAAELKGMGIEEYHNRPFHKNIFSDLTFFKKYVSHLERITKLNYLDNFLDSLNNEIKNKTRLLFRDYPIILETRKRGVHLKINHLYENREFITEKKLFGKVNLDEKVLVNAYYSLVDNSLYFSNVSPFPIKIIKVYNIQDTILFKKNIIILPKQITEKTIETVSLNKEIKDFEKSNLKVLCELYGTSFKKEIQVLPYTPDKKKRFFSKNKFKNLNNDSLEFLIINEQNKNIVVKNGQWNIFNNIIIPKGYLLICNAGTKLNFLNSSCLISYSPVQFLGTDENPIQIISSDSSSQGFNVIESKNESLLKNVVFQNLSSISYFGYELTGAITFYESDIRFENCTFQNSFSEDMVNIIRSKFSIIDCEFINIRSDAIDSDFSNGTIKYVSFSNITNDAIDLSGSLVTLKNIFIYNAGDKGVSAGENSIVDIKHITILDSNIGVASKDLSDVKISDLEIDNCEVGVVTYQKKPEFGPANIKLDHLYKIKNTNHNFLNEKNSEILINNQYVEETESIALAKILK